jgi:hypothetical protein
MGMFSKSCIILLVTQQQLQTNQTFLQNFFTDKATFKNHKQVQKYALQGCKEPKMTSTNCILMPMEHKQMVLSFETVSLVLILLKGT